MVANAKKHAWYYASFIVIQLIGLALVLSTSYDKKLQMTIVVITTVFYIFYALMHQYKHHHLTAKIVTEYVLIGSLGITVSFVLFGV